MFWKRNLKFTKCSSLLYGTCILCLISMLCLISLHMLHSYKGFYHSGSEKFTDASHINTLCFTCQYIQHFYSELAWLVTVGVEQLFLTVVTVTIRRSCIASCCRQEYSWAPRKIKIIIIKIYI